MVPDNNILPQTLLTLATRTVRRIYLDTAPLVAHDKEVDRLVGLAATLEKRLHEANEREDACRRARRMEEIRANAAAAEHVQAFFRRMGIGAALALIPLLVLFVLFDRALVHLSKGDVGIIRYLY